MYCDDTGWHPWQGLTPQGLTLDLWRSHHVYVAAGLHSAGVVQMHWIKSSRCMIQHCTGSQ
jgi:hypothetical protein